ncbi:MAG: hypothetical protein N2039_09720, partial [Gemmataceae bacterium]|nr:hypothetical protein [Gemmataceae bacterium]
VDAAEVEAEKKAAPFGRGVTMPGMPSIPLPVLLPAAVAASPPGVVLPKHSRYAEQLLAAIPSEIREAASDPFSARALVFGLLLSPEYEVRERQLAALQKAADRRDDGETKRLAPHIAQLPDAARLPVIDLAIPALRRTSRSQYQQFRDLIETLIRADGRVSLFEYVLRSAIERHLDSAFGRQRPQPTPPRPSLDSSIAWVVSCLAWAGHQDDGEAQSAFDAAVSKVVGTSLPMVPRSECRLDELDRHLGWLALASPSNQKKLLDACLSCIGHDGRITVREAELYRAIADVMGVPVPPLVPDA